MLYHEDIKGDEQENEYGYVFAHHLPHVNSPIAKKPNKPNEWKRFHQKAACCKYIIIRR
jgi:hypothetical protein